jgi:acyl carrier protein
MTESQLLDQLAGIFREVFDDPTLTVDADTTSADIERWDSMSQVTLAMVIEERLGVKFGAAEMEDLSSVRRIIEMLMPRLPTARVAAGA